MFPIILIVLGIVFIVLGGKVAIEKGYKIVKKFFVVFVVLGFVCLAVGLLFLYAPRGNDLLRSENTNGVTTGNDNINYQQENITIGNYVTANGNSSSYQVSVSEKTIYFNQQEIGDTEKFEEYLKTLDRMHTILLVDDYAVSLTYHRVKELLDAYGMNYEEVTNAKD